ncbi:secernin-1-like protein [Leptotrombidium deliense]|uniref:Secernin-1-like protein n=1 Tax=Leptotrombidium deliense TaxID=299467 RepID=A0A443SRF7_9ACAR|nr:secernin-1-like protein [Leptotrombidium deliense]
MQRLPKHRKRFADGTCLLKEHSNGNAFNIYSMMTTMSDEESNICRRLTAEFPTAAAQVYLHCFTAKHSFKCFSQISVLSKDGQHVHWFTGVPDPKHSIYKPFVFTENVELTSKICSQRLSATDDPAKMKPRFAKSVDRRHELYKLYEKCYETIVSDCESGACVRSKQRELQRKLVEKVESNWFVNKNEMFNDAVNEEIRFYESLL